MEQIIEEVRRYPCLWNKSKEEYRNQNIRDNAWERLSGELEKPGKYISNFNFYCKMQAQKFNRKIFTQKLSMHKYFY